jgi:hypothetical protein
VGSPFMRGTRSWRQDKVPHRNKFPLFQTLRKNWDFCYYFYIALFQIRIKCDLAVYIYTHIKVKLSLCLTN